MHRTRSTKRGARTAVKLGELAVAVPQVVAHRIGRMATAGTPMSQRDRTEFTGMVTEKHAAFTHAWWAVATQMGAAQQAMASMWWRALWAPWLGARRIAPSAFAAGMVDAAQKSFSAGLAPVHRKAVSNARRLAGSPRR